MGLDTPVQSELLVQTRTISTETTMAGAVRIAKRPAFELPLDKWFGTFHDGSQQAHEQMKDRRRQAG